MKLAKLDALLAQTSTSKQHAALFAEMLSLPYDVTGSHSPSIGWRSPTSRAMIDAPAATSPFFMGESLIQRKAAANEAGIAELACFIGDSSPDLVRIWPDEPTARRTASLSIKICAALLGLGSFRRR